MNFEFYSNDEIMTELGQRIKSRRISLNYSREDLATITQVSLSTIRRIENGENASVEQLLPIFRELGVLKNLDSLIPNQQ